MHPSCYEHAGREKVRTARLTIGQNCIGSNFSAPENHLCEASLRKRRKISLKAHRHAHGVGIPIARPEKLPRQ